MFVDMHMHEMTCSKDSFLKLEEMVEIAREKGHFVHMRIYKHTFPAPLFLFILNFSLTFHYINNHTGFQIGNLNMPSYI